MGSQLNNQTSLTTSDVPFDAIVEQSVVGIYIIQDECFVYSNAHWAAILGYTVEEMQNKHLSALVPGYFLPEVIERYQKRLQGDPPSMQFITHGIHKTGHEISIDVHGSRVLYRGRPAVLGVGVDVTDRLKAEADSARQSQMLKDLLGYTRSKLDEQRQQFSRDVHDLLGGMLTSIKMETSRVHRFANTPELAEMTTELMNLTQQTIDAVKTIARDLRPGDLEHLDLSVVIKRDLDIFAKRNGISASYVGCPDPSGLTPRRATAVYRIFHEALTNISRHAEAQRIDVSLSCVDESYILDLRDDGKGFSLQGEGQQSLGILGMHERAKDVGATLTFDASKGHGTFLRLQVPLL